MNFLNEAIAEKIKKAYEEGFHDNHGVSYYTLEALWDSSFSKIYYNELMGITE